MAFLSLVEAAEQAAASKADVWRAIQQGALPACKTSEGYAIDPADLFRIFRRRRPEPAAPAPLEEGRAAEGRPSESAAADDVSLAFAELQAELKNLLGVTGKDEQRDEAAAGNEKTSQAAPDDRPATQARPRRPWWSGWLP